MSLATPKLRLKVLVLEVRPTLGSSLNFFSQPFKWRRGTPPLWPRSLWWAVGGTDSEIVWINAETYLIHLVEEREGNRLLVRTLYTHLQSTHVAHTHICLQNAFLHTKISQAFTNQTRTKRYSHQHTQTLLQTANAHTSPHTHTWPGNIVTHSSSDQGFPRCTGAAGQNDLQNVNKIKKTNVIQNVQTIKIVYDVYVSFIQDNNHYMYQIYSQSIQVFTWEWNER